MVRGAVVLLCAMSATAMDVEAQRVRLDATPELTVPATTESGDLRFATAAWATRISTGEIAVADLAESNVRVLSPAGKLERVLGRRGAGPGEYRLPIWVGVCDGGNLTVWDASGRVSVYSSAAARSETPVTRTVPEGASSLTASCSRSGQLAVVQGMAPRRDIPPVLSGESPGGGQYQVVQMGATLVSVTQAGAARSVRESISQGQWVMGRISPQGGMGAVPRPLSPATSFAFAGDELVVADGATGDVVGLASDGREAFRFSAAAPARRPTADDYARAAVAAVAMVPAQIRDDAVTFVKSIPLPEQLPHFTRVLADPDGLIWLVTSPDGATETRFRVYTRAGQLVAEPRVPGAFVAFEVGVAHLLGKRQNADGEDEIVMLRVTRARETGRRTR